MRVIVFDFDKTLTYRDSFTQLCIRRMRHPIRWWIFPVYVSLKVLSKCGLLSIKKEKEISIRLLFPRDISRYRKICRDFALHIGLSSITEKLNEAVACRERVIILSASPQEYICALFPMVEVYALELKCGRDGKIMGIDKHPYGFMKLQALAAKGVVHIDEMYYDSHSDEVLIPICKVWHKVSAGNIIGTYSKF